MNKDELLKIYSAYLPYGLELQHKYEKAKHSGETVLRSWVKPLEPLDLGCLFPHRKDSFDWKPILYDLSYLTKEIEHEGETFIPVEIIEEAFNTDVEMDSEDTFLIGEKGKDRDLLGIEELPYIIVQKFLELHLNIFGLPEDQFINKATLTHGN